MPRLHSRRSFMQLSALGAGGLLAPTTQSPGAKALPLPAGNDKKLKILCLGAHPGDPEFGCGGTMAKYAAEGHEVTFLYVTRGEAYDDKLSHGAAAAKRTKEAETACNGLKVTPKFFGQIDGATVASPEENKKMLNIIKNETPDLVFTQWPVDTHPDHQVTGLLALNAWTKMNRAFDLYFYEVNTGSETMTFVPTDYVDISNFKEKKKAAMWAHQTQEPEKTYNDFFKEMEAFRGLEAKVPAAEAFIHYKSVQQSVTSQPHSHGVIKLQQ